VESDESSDFDMGDIIGNIKEETKSDSKPMKKSNTESRSSLNVSRE